LDQFVVDLTARRKRKQRFFTDGQQISDWAQAHGFNRDLVYGVLAGRTKGQRGEAHRIAVALGLKRVDPAYQHEALVRTGQDDNE
jgi:gp16 family phage-associated protein